MDMSDILDFSCPSLFKCEKGEAMSFFLKIENKDLKSKYNKLICRYGGRVEDSSEGITSYTAVLADSRQTGAFGLFCFNVSYILECIREKTLLDISNYLLNRPSLKVELDPMSVIYWRRQKFPTVTRTVCCNDSSSSDESNPIRPNTKARLPRQYTTFEKEAMLKFIIKHDAFSELKGVYIYKKMERHNICPTRSYNSMRAHFLNFLVNELDKFSFLTKENKAAILDATRNTNSTDEEESITSQNQSFKKHTREAYSNKEKEAMLKFIVENKEYNNLKGTAVYKRMEKRNICPQRTFFSMRAHFLKLLINELDKFSFLSEKHKKAIRSGAAPVKKTL